MKNIDENSSVNQDIKRKFVEDNVYYCQSMLVEEALAKEILSYDDIENMYGYNTDYGFLSEQEYEDKKEELQEEIDALGDKISDKEDEIEELEDENLDIEIAESELKDLEDDLKKKEDELYELEQEESEAQEVYEWWLVSDWLAGKLRDHNEPILDDLGCTWWGRTTSGQAILLDGVISRICAELNMLK